jgi:hypothetical protein
MPVNVGGYSITSQSEKYLDIVPFTTDGLSIFLDAGDKRSYSGTGTSWRDLSGNGHNFTWVSTPTFTSNGNKSYLTTLGNRCQGPPSNSVGINNTSGYTVFLVFQQNSLNGTSSFKFYKDGASSASRGIFAHTTWSNNYIYFDQGGCCNTDTRVFVDSGGVTSFSVISLRRETAGSTRTIWKNGTLLATETAAAANIDLNSTPIDVGSSDEYGGDSSTWDAYLNSFVVYNKGLSDTDIQAVSSYFETRYGI